MPVETLRGQHSDVFCISQCGKQPCLLFVTCYVFIVLLCSPDNKNNTHGSCVISHVYCHSYRRQLVKLRLLTDKQSCAETELRVFFDI